MIYQFDCYLSAKLFAVLVLLRATPRQVSIKDYVVTVDRSDATTEAIAKYVKGFGFDELCQAMDHAQESII